MSDQQPPHVRPSHFPTGPPPAPPSTPNGSPKPKGSGAMLVVGAVAASLVVIAAGVAILWSARSSGGESSPISSEVTGTQSPSSSTTEDLDSGTSTTAPETTTSSTNLPAVDTSIRPQVVVPKGDPPTELIIEDNLEGMGPEATLSVSDQFVVDYVGVVWSTGEEFDASWDRGEPFTFSSAGVIEGFSAGVTGMKVGGRRTITIPPDLGYGANGNPPAIAPNETLIFVIDLRSIG